ncbi:MAG: S1 RNA-binding domain-containing protein, partial [Pseudomonadota bacterium]|nr:S1 RNA-binding domain-containing protein [Pseudomonadota bacterium]
GAFISLGDGAADGFLPVRSLPDDYYVINDAGMQMRGRHNGLALSVGDIVEVLVVDVTPINGGILLAYTGGGSTNSARPKGKGGAKRGRAGRKSPNHKGKKPRRR